WLNRQWRDLVYYRATTMYFLVAVFWIDLLIRALYPWCPEAHHESPAERLALIFAFWGGSTPLAELDRGSLLDSDEMVRRRRLATFYQIVRRWPRVNLPDMPETFASTAEFETFERKVWLAYVQTYIDYLRRYPPFPMAPPSNAP
ncbi:hypothetical protein BKA62DRAFT_600014, partial [Auriculariales sp. MPI-PUGE-AT-0066]